MVRQLQTHLQHYKGSSYTMPEIVKSLLVRPKVCIKELFRTNIVEEIFEIRSCIERNFPNLTYSAEDGQATLHPTGSDKLQIGHEACVMCVYVCTYHKLQLGRPLQWPETTRQVTPVSGWCFSPAVSPRTHQREQPQTSAPYSRHQQGGPIMISTVSPLFTANLEKQ